MGIIILIGVYDIVFVIFVDYELLLLPSIVDHIIVIIIVLICNAGIVYYVPV